MGDTAIIDFNKTSDASLLKTISGRNVPGKFINTEKYSFYLVVDNNPAKVSAFFELSEKINNTSYQYNAYGSDPIPKN